MTEQLLLTRLTATAGNETTSLHNGRPSYRPS